MSPYSPDFNKELFYEPTDEELGNIEAGPGRVASVGGLLGRFARKMVADPIRGMYRAVDKARTGGFKDPEEMGRAALETAGNMAGTPGFGSGLGSGARVAKPWQSRTLDTISGVLPAGKKFPDAATPQTWLSKLKGAGLPKEEVATAENFLTKADPKTKFSREQLSWALDNKLPEMGVTVTELGGPKWAEGQKKLDDLPVLINNTKIRAESRIHELYKEKGGPVSREEYMADPEYQEIMKLRKNYLDEQLQLSTDAVGKRPRWPQYNTEGVQNPREILYHGKPKSGEPEYINSDMETHYGSEQGKNLIFHQREGELTLPDGKKSTHISEQQSDWHSEYANQPKGEITAFRDMPRAGQVYADNDILTMRQILGDDLPNVSEMSDDRVRSMFRMQFGGLGKSRSIPEPPMKDIWHKTGFKDAVKRAVEAGHDYVTWDTADTQIKRWPAGEGAEKYFRGHYDDKLVKFAAKEYGVKPEKVPTGVVASHQRGEHVIMPVDDFNDPETHLSLNGFRVESNEGVGSDLRYSLGHTDVDGGIEAPWNDFESPHEARRFLDELRRIDPEKTNKEVWRIPITDDMKRKVLLEGQYWSKKDKAATPGGRNAEGIA